MPATLPSNKANFTLFAFTPRQVLLNNQAMKHNADNGTRNLKREQMLLLHQSIAHYLERSGFSKTLKKFRSEAQIEKDGLEGSSVDLEEMCLKYLEICGKDAKSNINGQKEQGVHSENKEGKSKEKKKKKSKLVSESLANNVEDNQLESPTMVTENNVKDGGSIDAKVINGVETEKRSKKKKKKDKASSLGDTTEQSGDPKETDSKKENLKSSNKEVTYEEKKDSKKRKRSIPEENGKQVSDTKVDEEPKRRKTENLNESKGGEQSGKTNANLGSDLNSNKENIAVCSQVGGDQLQKASNEKTNVKTNGDLENAGEKYSVQRSQKKQQKGSVEQKSVKAFQRVKVDEFAHEKLLDNSYWAKDGAESGYGAKAEEILSQVRGRDFRHEKTKKKRGTYRGGQIDLQSHSIKFNYSDDD
ncbi:suppressor protein SRP40 isoform X2 [Gastrolobium bilobum]|uniref:suppressor protein SRP40 isoform X2 n=1 Tax=Gastrolobium bilobum TaxID=150636 RepID=UPI002AAFA23E|nr:suppressor protein SRP40 isoform X2 [Gastrolobium bilobum]